ncbi:MAG: Crp/Fnr family transcriptional regulator [Candidatus Peregrinibacteria bacterium GW2011_GWA2_33_10]|nr:MAG: Crp/Fnr family transcriptional regulator [Candidatus Peregrinibacteria bacterium GW2011_GWA2_33_10]KKP41267.1 MAG: mechanosensitive ion channel MscS [Candidatus Peregrinibacteria bacterium GW2011_GWC2_33_13]
METFSILPILQKIPIFQDLNEQDHKEIIDRITLQYFPANTIIFSEGDPGDKMYIIKTGLVKVFKTENSQEKELAILGENEFFGEMALISEAPRNASIITLEECELFTFSKQDFLKLTSTNQHMATIINDEFIKRVKENQKYDI